MLFVVYCRRAVKILSLHKFNPIGIDTNDDRIFSHFTVAHEFRSFQCALCTLLLLCCVFRLGVDIYFFSYFSMLSVHAIVCAIIYTCINSRHQLTSTNLDACQKAFIQFAPNTYNLKCNWTVSTIKFYRIHSTDKRIP